MNSLESKHVQVVKVRGAIGEKEDTAELGRQAAKSGISGTGSSTVDDASRKRAR